MTGEVNNFILQTRTVEVETGIAFNPEDNTIYYKDLEDYRSGYYESVVYGINHVITPIRVINVIYQGKDLSLNNDDIINALERYYFVTEQIPIDLTEHQIGEAIATYYEPMQSGKTYVLYLSKGL